MSRRGKHRQGMMCVFCYQKPVNAVRVTGLDGRDARACSSHMASMQITEMSDGSTVLSVPKR